MSFPMPEMMVCDLDGTLLDAGGDGDPADRKAWQALGEAGVVRVLATGRHLYSLRQVLDEDYPVDYLIFSGGAGICRQADGEVLLARTMSSDHAQKVLNLALRCDLDLMVHEPLPANHCFRYRISAEGPHPDFMRRLERYRGFARPLRRRDESPPEPASMMLSMIAPGGPEHWKDWAREVDPVRVVCSTSPLDGETLWVEWYPPGCDKGHSLLWLADHLGVAPAGITALGNDYNDLSMLEVVGEPWVVEGAPESLRRSFPVVPCRGPGALGWLHDRWVGAAARNRPGERLQIQGGRCLPQG